MQLFLGFFTNMVAELLSQFSLSEEQIQYFTYSIVPFLGFLLVLIITLYLLRHEYHLRHPKQTNWIVSLIWAIGGVFLVFFAQAMAIYIESFFYIPPGSENTEGIMEMIEMAPMMIIVTCLLGPVLEEVIFRKIIFGSLYEQFGFWIAAIGSSILFALAHLEIEHTILYSAIGITFSFLYVKTKRIVVPIITHSLMNSIVVLVQSIYQEQLENYVQHVLVMFK